MKKIDNEEQVTWGVDWGKDGDRSCVSIIKKHADGTNEVVAVEYEPQFIQEPVAWMDENGWASVYKDELYNIPLCAAPVRTKDLTPHEITALIREGAADGGWQGFAQRVIAADREKNKCMTQHY